MQRDSKTELMKQPQQGKNSIHHYAFIWKKLTNLWKPTVKENLKDIVNIKEKAEQKKLDRIDPHKYKI